MLKKDDGTFHLKLIEIRLKDSSIMQYLRRTWETVYFNQVGQACFIKVDVGASTLLTCVMLLSLCRLHLTRGVAAPAVSCICKVHYERRRHV